ncbi:MAG: hypothetical protein EAZ91_21730 [Cytophagales bacterium]|nr:MAG: hypothetical protein EAZ91_21730 [Cytophagales bacterium]
MAVRPMVSDLIEMASVAVLPFFLQGSCGISPVMRRTVLCQVVVGAEAIFTAGMVGLGWPSFAGRHIN